MKHLPTKFNYKDIKNEKNEMIKNPSKRTDTYQIKCSGENYDATL